jgi:hypothetical protein
MTPPDPKQDPASALVEAARAFHRAAETRGSHRAAPEFLASLQEVLQVLSSAWYRVAADAVHRGDERTRAAAADPGASPCRGDLSREQEVRLIGALHDVAAAFARCARACREGNSTVTPVIARRQLAESADAVRTDADASWFASRRPRAERVA